MNKTTTTYTCTVQWNGKRWIAHVYHVEGGWKIDDFIGERQWKSAANAQGEALDWAEDNLPDGSY